MSMDKNRSFIVSFLTMRRLIGVLGISLPIIVVIGGFLQSGSVLQGSISGYYYTNMRDFFVGLLCVVSLFLMSYRGYEEIDDLIGNLSGIFALGVVVFPTSMYCDQVVKVGIFLLDDNISEYIHLTFGALFFFSLSFNSIFLFTRRHPGVLGREKRRRNLIYRLCGIVMILSILCIAICTLFLRDTYISKFYPVLIFESIALFAFGISWLVKGHTLFKDR
ncbi:MAG: DUF998 domain-containing protein [Bacteroidetes bacterium]|nr:DUF998 domain-containing protein [Bacteroidota bacterium]